MKISHLAFGAVCAALAVAGSVSAAGIISDLFEETSPGVFVLDGANLKDSSVTDAKISGVSGAKLTNGSVTDAKISGVSGAKLVDNSVTGTKLANGSVTDAKISGVDGDKLFDNSVTGNKLVSVPASKITGIPAGYLTGSLGGNVWSLNSGNFGIGTATPGAKLEVGGQVKITGGAPGAGKVLTSDASGLASWQAPVAGSTLDAVIAANPWTDKVPAFHGGVDLGNGDTSGGAFDTAGIKAWNTINLYSSWGAATYHNAALWAIQFDPRNGDAAFKGQLKIMGGAPGAGKVLTSDASGNASWKAPAGGTQVMDNEVKSILENKSASCSFGYVPSGCSGEGEKSCIPDASRTVFTCAKAGARGNGCWLFCMKLQ